MHMQYDNISSLGLLRVNGPTSFFLIILHQKLLAESLPDHPNPFQSQQLPLDVQ